MKSLFIATAAATLAAGCAAPTDAELSHMRDAEARLAVCANDSEKLDSILDLVTLPTDKQQSLLVAAVNHDNRDCVEVMLEHGFDPDSTFGGRPLFIACRKNRVQMAEMLLDAGAGILDEYMVNAVRGNQLELAEVLLKHGAAPKPNLIAGCSPDMLKLLLKYGLKPNDRGADGVPPLLYAIDEASYPKAEMLLDAGAKTNLIPSSRRLEDVKNTALILLLVKHGATLKPIQSRQNIFAMAVRESNLELLDLMLKEGFTIDKSNLEIIFGAAAQSGDLLVMKKILDGCGDNLLNCIPEGQPFITDVFVKESRSSTENTRIIAELIEHGMPCRPEIIISTIRKAMKQGDDETVARICRLIVGRPDEMQILALSCSYTQDNTILKKMLDAGCTPPTDSPMLAVAIVRGDNELADMLMTRKAGINSMDREFNTPLIYACKKADLKMVEKLLEAGADVNYSTSSQNSALAAAMTAYLQTLTHRGAPCTPGTSPSTNSIYNLEKIIGLLVASGAKVAPYPTQDSMLMMDAVVRAGNTELMDKLLAAGISPSIQIFGCPTPLAKAATYGGSPNMFEYLLDHGADPNTILPNGTSLLQWLTLSSDVTKVRSMLDHGANPNIRNLDNSTPLMKVCSISIADMLIAAGADVNARDAKKQTVLMTMGDMSPDMLEFMVKAGIDVNAQNADGTTALMRAARENSPAAIRMLLSLKANPMLTDKAGKTALDYTHNKDISAIIEQAMVVEQADVKPTPTAKSLEAATPEPDRVVGQPSE